MTNSEMKKTIKMAAAKAPHNHWINRRVYADESGVEYIKINGIYFELDWLMAHGWEIDIAF